MTKKQALDYFHDDRNWETVEHGVKGMLELQRLKGTDCYRAVIKGVYMIYSAYTKEPPTDRTLCYMTLKHETKDGVPTFESFSTSQDQIASLVKGAGL